jgi:hypothetical protein
MATTLQGFVYDNAGNPISGATVQGYVSADNATVAAGSATTTDSNGKWAITTSDPNHIPMDIKITYGSNVRWLKGYDKISLTDITVSGSLTVGEDDTGHDVKMYGATTGKFLLWDEANDSLSLTDGTSIKIGTDGDMTLRHDGTDSYISNSAGDLKIATEQSGIAVTIGHTTSEVTVADNLTVSGDLTVSGSTTTVDTTNQAVQDSLIELNSGAASNPTNDLGIVMERGSTGDNAIVAWDESDDQFVVGTTTADGSSSGGLTISPAPLVASDVTANLTGDVTGDVTGNVTGNLTGNVTGNVTGDVTGNVTGNVTGTAATVTGATQASITSAANLDTVGTITTGIWQATDVGVEHGGTGVSSFTDAGVLIGNGTGAVQATSAGTAGQVLTSNGTGVDPTFQDAASGGGGGVSIQATAAQNFTAGDPVGGFNSSGQLTGFLKRSASAGRNWDIYGGGNVSSDVIIPDSTSTSLSIKGNAGPLLHYLTGEDCILALYIKESDDYLYGRVGTIASNGATTWGTEAAIASTAFSYGIASVTTYGGPTASLTPLESSVGTGKMLVSYQPSSGSSSTTSLYHRVLTIVGGTTRSITVGAETTQTVTSGYNTPVSGIEGGSGSGEAALLSLYGDNTNKTGKVYVTGATISGSTITLGSQVEVASWYSFYTSGGNRSFTDQHVTGAYNVTRDSYAIIYYFFEFLTSPSQTSKAKLYLRSFTQSGTTITLSTAVELSTVLTDITWSDYSGGWSQTSCYALVWDTPNTRWVCYLSHPGGTSYTGHLDPVIGVFTEATVGTYAKVGNTLRLSGSGKLSDSTVGAFAHQYSWNTSIYQGLRAMNGGSLTVAGPSNYGYGQEGYNKAQVVNVNDYTINPYLRYDSADSAWYAINHVRLTSWRENGTALFPVHFKLSFDGTDWTVDKATVIDTVDTNFGTGGSDYAGFWSFPSRAIYDPDNDWYIKFGHFTGNSSTGTGRNAASYNATGDEEFGEGFAYMVWDDADVSDYAGLYMVPTEYILGTAANTVTSGGTLTVNIGDHSQAVYSFPSAPTGKPLSRAAVGPDGTIVTYRTIPISKKDASDSVTTVGTAVNTDTLLFGFDTVTMP